MTFKKYNHTNNAFCELLTALTDSDTTMLLQGNYNRFPTQNFIVKLSKISGNSVVARENIYVANRNNNICTWLIRAYEKVPMDDDATEGIQQALNFSAGDMVECVVSSEVITDLQNRVENAVEKNGGLRTGFPTDGILSVENGTEKVLNNLPQGMVDGIKTPILTEVWKKLDAENVYVEGVVRETIPNALTPVCFVEGWEYTQSFFPLYYNDSTISSRQFPFEVTITWIYIDMKVDFYSTKAFTIIPYNSAGQALQTENIEFNYNASKKEGLNIRTSKLDVRMSQGFNSQNTFYITVKFQLERGFYKFQHNATYGKLVWFLKNKSIGENAKIADIATKKHIPLDVANGSYCINESGLLTLWTPFTDEYLIRTAVSQYPPNLRLGRVQNGILAVNLQNVGYFQDKTYIFSGLRKIEYNDTPKYHLLTHQYSDVLHFFI